jgi:hypothetical protein
MINFVNTQNELSFQIKFGIPDKCYGLQVAKKNAPLDFQYDSTEVISSFIAVKVDNNENPIDSINLSTSLIDFTGTQHICDGLTDYSSDLDAGLYYFLVNSKHKSEYFVVSTDLVQAPLGNTPITVSGLEFYDTQNDINWLDKIGSPVATYAEQYGENSTPLPFRYFASDAVSTFVAVNNTTLEETNLTVGLIASNGTYHTCDGLSDYSSDLSAGTYYFLVNDRYRSDIFCVVELQNVVAQDALLLETGDYLLLETGDRLLLE